MCAVTTLTYGSCGRAAGEPNGGESGENFVELDMRGGIDATATSSSLNRQGGWNDQHAGGDGNLGKYPMCETRAPDKKNVAGVHSLNGATNTQQYVGVTQQMTWPQARAYCQSQYHDLAAVHDEASNEYLRQLCSQQIASLGGANGGLNGGNGDSCWIGLNDIGTDGTQVWSDGTEVDFTDWIRGEPNGYANGGNEETSVRAAPLAAASMPTCSCVVVRRRSTSGARPRLANAAPRARARSGTTSRALALPSPPCSQLASDTVGCSAGLRDN